jgi:plastocyanin
VGFACASVLVVTLVPTAHARPVVIRGIAQRWSPATATVSRGTVVKWRGVSKFHDVLAYGGNWNYNKSLPVGATVKKRFRGAGTFRFRCTFHSTLIGTSCTGMCGSVRVTS